MESNQVILPTQIREILGSNDISQILLKDGTILRITGSPEPKNISQNPEQEILENKAEENELEEEHEGHNHHKGGFGYFGQHFKTEYNELCPDCMNGGGVIKKRKNYVLYVSNNCSGNDVALKHKLKKKEKEIVQEKIEEQIEDQIKEQIKENIEEQIKENIEEQIKENIEEQIKEEINQEEQNQENQENQILKEENKVEENQENEEEPKEIIVERYVECNDVPVLDEKIILKKDEDKKEENLCDNCKNEEINNLQQEEKVCNECKEEGEKEENINNEVQEEANNINNNQDNLEEEEMEQQNVNEVGEENLGDEVQAEQQNEGNEEPKITTTVEVFIPENQNANEE